MTRFNYSGLKSASLALLLAAGTASAHAADFDAPATEFADGIRFELGIGASVRPAYEGSDEYKVGPTGTGGLDFFKMGNFMIGGGDDLGLSFGPSFRILGEREASEYPILSGIPDVDFSFELGAKVAYEWEAARVFATARYGVVGHNGFVGELGADAIWRFDQQTKFTIGPRVSYADQEYFDTYFSVPVTALNLSPYRASSGFKSAGIEASIRHDFNDAWAIETSASWDRLIGDAEESPIVKAGSENQFSGKINLIRKFNFNF